MFRIRCSIVVLAACLLAGSSAGRHPSRPSRQPRMHSAIRCRPALICDWGPHAALRHFQRTDRVFAGWDATRLGRGLSGLHALAVDTNQGSEVRQLRGLGTQVNVLRFLPDGKTLISADQMGTLLLLDVATGREIRRFGRRNATARITCAALSPDRRLLWTAGTDRVIRQYLLAAGVELRQLVGHQSPVVALAATPDGKRLVSAGQDGTVQIWDLAEQAAAVVPRLGQRLGWRWRFRRTARCSPSSPSGSGWSAPVTRWRSMTSKRARCSEKSRADARSGADLCPQRQGAGGDCQQERGGVWRGLRNRKLAALTSAHRASSAARGQQTLAFSDDSKLLACSLNNQAISVWDLGQSRRPAPGSGPHRGGAKCCLSEKGELISPARPIDVRLSMPPPARSWTSCIEVDNSTRHVFPGPRTTSSWPAASTAGALRTGATAQLRESAA